MYYSFEPPGVYSFASETADFGQILLQSGLRTVLLGDV